MSDVYSLYGSVVHDVADTSTGIALFGSVVHDVADTNTAIGLFASVVHNDIPAPPSGGGSNLQGEFLQGIRMQSWGLQGEQAQGE